MTLGGRLGNRSNPVDAPAPPLRSAQAAGRGIKRWSNSGEVPRPASP